MVDCVPCVQTPSQDQSFFERKKMLFQRDYSFVAASHTAKPSYIMHVKCVSCVHASCFEFGAVYATFDQDHQIDTTSFFCLGVFRPGARLARAFLLLSKGAKQGFAPFVLQPPKFIILSPLTPPTKPTPTTNHSSSASTSKQTTPGGKKLQYTGARVRSTPALFSWKKDMHGYEERARRRINM